MLLRVAYLPLVINEEAFPTSSSASTQLRYPTRTIYEIFQAYL